jgi:hypothetical protein
VTTSRGQKHWKRCRWVCFSQPIPRFCMPHQSFSMHPFYERRLSHAFVCSTKSLVCASWLT